MEYTLPSLNYSYSDLEPYIDAATMEVHHTGHHQAYVTNLNKALKDAHVNAPEDINELISDLSTLPASIRTAVRNNGGGHANHSFFWKLLNAKGAKVPQANGKLAAKIDETFGSLEALKEKFNQAATGRFGSGWAWLCWCRKEKVLFIYSTANQDHPRMKEYVERCGMPLIGLDVWEHAYYLKHKNKRPAYIKDFWEVLDWNQVEKNYALAMESA